METEFTKADQEAAKLRTEAEKKASDEKKKVTVTNIVTFITSPVDDDDVRSLRAYVCCTDAEDGVAALAFVGSRGVCFVGVVYII